ncbi:MAG: exodeoxyribonuclease III [Acidobacteriota bacterium]
MRIATWNINGLRARLDFLIHWLRDRQPDVVGLQELKVEEDSFPYRELELAGYQSIVHGQKAWNGVAILSRRPAEIRQKGLPGQEQEGARLITGQVAGISFTTVYCPNGKQVGHPDFPCKLSWFDSLSSYLQERRSPNEPMVLCGDFNICPSLLDTWNEKELGGRIFHTVQERSRFQKLLDWGLVDVYRATFPQGRSFSWWDYRGGAFHKNQGLRIDFLLATRSLMARIHHVEIDRDYRKKKAGLTASDHAPVLADLS